MVLLTDMEIFGIDSKQEFDTLLANYVVKGRTALETQEECHWIF